MQGPALGMLELGSVARGIKVTDDMVKKAPIEILCANTISPGKYIIMITGEVANVAESLQAGVESGDAAVINKIFLAQVHPEIVPALKGERRCEVFASLGIIESQSVATCIEAADIALKEAPVTLVEMRIVSGLGGKGYFVLSGTLADIEAAVIRSRDYVAQAGMLVGSEIIPAPHDEMVAKGVYWQTPGTMFD